MSDGSISQDEIDALLAGVDSTGFGSAPSGAFSGGEVSLIQDFLDSTIQALSYNLSTMTGASVSFKSVRVEQGNRDALLQQLPDMVVAIKDDFVSGIPGEHLYILPDDAARRLAGVMNNEKDIELDDMALSGLTEIASQVSGTVVTALSDKTGNKAIAAEPPSASFVPKAVVALPAGDFIKAAFELDFGDGSSMSLWEVFGAGVSSDMARALGGGGDRKNDDVSGDLNALLGGMGAPAPNIRAPAASAGAFGGQSGGGMDAGFGMGGLMGGNPNVQSIQFPSLMPQSAPGEQGNINLIMDVYMEMTVELGRTRKLIKEILGMGEGTIIELDKLAGEPVDILVNHKLIAKGEVVVIDENFGVRVTEIVSPMERMSEMG